MGFVRLTQACSLLLMVIAFAGCQTAPKALPTDISPTQATWLYGKYIIPAEFVTNNKTITFQQGVGESPWPLLAASVIKPGAEVPVVLYLHGCRGMSHQADRFSDLLLSEGYAVFMPDSFKRPGRKQCSMQGRLQNRVALRTEEVRYALNQIKQLPWVDQDRLVLMGFSEGGNTTDNWSQPGFAGHLVMGSACTLVGGKPAAPNGTPVLAVVGANDRYRPGKSCRIDDSDGISKSIVLPGVGHAVAQYPKTEAAIRTFLKKCCS